MSKQEVFVVTTGQIQPENDTPFDAVIVIGVFANLGMAEAALRESVAESDDDDSEQVGVSIWETPNDGIWAMTDDAAIVWNIHGRYVTTDL